jgi:hypothetical protein
VSPPWRETYVSQQHHRSSSNLKEQF